MKLNIKAFTTPWMLLSLLLSLLMPLLSINKASAAYDGGKLVDNRIFLNAASLSIQDIQNFLVSKGSGLASRNFILNCYAQDSKERQWYTAAGAPCDQNVPASKIIYYAAQIYGINPQVILATLQKEQSLITSPNPTEWQINQAMGYACPTTGGCGSSDFFYQIDSGVWVLRYHYERARGNMTWWNTSTTWTCGTEKNFYKPNLYPGQDVRFYDEDGVLYRTHRIENAATSSMYCYTPHTYNNPQGLYGRPPYGTVGRYYSGSYNFVFFFEQWFGPTIGWYCGNADSSPVNVGTEFGKIDPKVDVGNFFIYSGSSTQCIESHAWNPGMGTWKNHTASNHPNIVPPGSKVIYGDLNGDSIDEPILVGLTGTGGGMIEFHVWNSDMRSWQAHYASNMPVIEPDKADVQFADLDGDGKDEAVLVGYNGTGSGMIEFHVWNSGMGTWRSHHASNMPVIWPIGSRVTFGDLDGDGRDEAVLVGYNGTGSGMIEFHVWNSGMGTWRSHHASNMPVVSTDGAKIVLADIDGNNVDEAALIGLKGTGSGMIELHVWNSGMGTWRSHHASNQQVLE